MTDYGSIPTDENGDNKDAKVTAATGKSSTLQLLVVFLAGVFIAVLACNFLASPSQVGLEDEAAKTTDNVITTLSKRGSSIELIRDDLLVFMKGAADPYDPLENPDGYLVMLVAENKLMWKEMAQKLESAMSKSPPVPSWVLGYGDMGGEIHFKQTMATMMQRWIDAPINATLLQFQSGVGSVLDQLSYVLADPGDGALVTSPSYNPFQGDLGVHGGMQVHTIPVTAEQGYIPTLQDLEDGYEKAVAAGNTPRIMIICQPNNPTGVVYSHDEMMFMMKWALEKDLHIISDEIYALSVFPGHKTTSAADIMYEINGDIPNYLGDNVHIVSGLSKDWGLSGF